MEYIKLLNEANAKIKSQQKLLDMDTKALLEDSATIDNLRAENQGLRKQLAEVERVLRAVDELYKVQDPSEQDYKCWADIEALLLKISPVNKSNAVFENCVAYKDSPTGYILEPCSTGPSVDCSKGWPVPESWGERVESKEDYIEKLQVRMEGLEDMLDKVAANYAEDALRYRWLIKRSEEIYVVPSTQIGKNLSVDSFGVYSEVKNQIDEEIDNLMDEELQ